MDKKIKTWLNKNIPQNFIVSSPVTGSLILGIFSFLFLLLYKPLEVDQGHFSYEFSIGLYSFITAASSLCTIYLLKQLTRFRDVSRWSIRKEMEAIVLVTAVTGVMVYLTGFIVEEALAPRWHILVFLDSVFKTFLVAGIPFLFFSSLNIYGLIHPATNYPNASKSDASLKPKLIELSTPLKNEEIRFYPREIIYAYSEGNYVIFMLSRNDELVKKMVRCALSKVEEQLKDYPFLFRTHRKYIVNLNKVENVSGNSLGYKLRLPFAEEKIPVARSRAANFKKNYPNTI